VSDYLLSVVLGIVEGLTEFLPVSSTAHLRISESLLGIKLDDGYWKMYSVVIQLGAVLCLPVYFRGRIAKFLSTFPKGERGDRTVLTHPVSLTLLAFVVTAVPAFLLKHTIGKNLESLYVIGAALLVGGVVMWVVDAIFGERVAAATDGPAAAGRAAAAAAPAAGVAALGYAPAGAVVAKTSRVEDMTLMQAIWIGAVQILSAVFPGTSRSMCTIAAGQTAGMTRASALEFSFFLSLPTMAAATVYDFYKTVIKHKGEAGEALPPVDMTTQRWVVLAIGFAVSFVVALAVVAWFMGWVRKRGFTPFAVYRIVVGTAVLAWAWRG
jgi:undecaprenyl-diphosphatase